VPGVDRLLPVPPLPLPPASALLLPPALPPGLPPLAAATAIVSASPLLLLLAAVLVVVLPLLSLPVSASPLPVLSPGLAVEDRSVLHCPLLTF
jgi:hypothetical protein